jgi:hypothetical protein
MTQPPARPVVAAFCAEEKILEALCVCIFHDIFFGDSEISPRLSFCVFEVVSK